MEYFATIDVGTNIPTPWHASMWLQSRNKMFVPLSSRILLEMQHVSLIFCSENKCRFFGKALFDWISLPWKQFWGRSFFGEPSFFIIDTLDSCQLQLQIIVIKKTIVYFTNGLTEYCKLCNIDDEIDFTPSTLISTWGAFEVNYITTSLRTVTI